MEANQYQLCRHPRWIVVISLLVLALLYLLSQVSHGTVRHLPSRDPGFSARRYLKSDYKTISCIQTLLDQDVRSWEVIQHSCHMINLTQVIQKIAAFQTKEHSYTTQTPTSPGKSLYLKEMFTDSKQAICPECRCSCEKDNSPLAPAQVMARNSLAPSNSFLWTEDGDSKEEGNFLADAPQTNLNLQCKTFRDLSSEAEEDLIPRTMKFPSLITTCGGSKPRLLSQKSHTLADQKNHLDRGFQVPNIVHYVWFGEPMKFTFLNYLSMLSVKKFLHADYIFLHGDTLPVGKWWLKALEDVANIFHVNRMRPVKIHGRKTAYHQHSADVTRLEVLLDYGGIYLDFDVLVLKSFDPLRKYPVTLGRETTFSLANGIILAKRSAPFLRIWLETYHSFRENEWGEHSCLMPNRLLPILPHLLHVEETSLVRPSWQEAELLFKDHYDWRDNFAMHIWKRRGYVPHEPEQLRKLDNTLGEVMRHVWHS